MEWIFGKEKTLFRYFRIGFGTIHFFGFWLGSVGFGCTLVPIPRPTCRPLSWERLVWMLELVFPLMMTSLDHIDSL